MDLAPSGLCPAWIYDCSQQLPYVRKTLNWLLLSDTLLSEQCQELLSNHDNVSKYASSQIYAVISPVIKNNSSTLLTMINDDILPLLSINKTQRTCDLSAIIHKYYSLFIKSFHYIFIPIAFKGKNVYPFNFLVYPFTASFCVWQFIPDNLTSSQRAIKDYFPKQ